MQDKDNQNIPKIVTLDTEDAAAVTYAPLANKFSNFEVAYLSFQKAIEIIRSAAYLSVEQKGKYKPKVAVVAFESLCEDPEGAKHFKEEVVRAMFSESGEDKHDAYNVDDGHLPKNADNS